MGSGEFPVYRVVGVVVPIVNDQTGGFLAVDPAGVNQTFHQRGFIASVVHRKTDVLI
jgi:hypothetical protein